VGKAIKLVFVSALLLVVVAVGLYAAVNWKDEDIKPEYKAILEQKFEVPANAVNGFKYLAGIQVAEHLDPMKRGSEIYERAVDDLKDHGTEPTAKSKDILAQDRAFKLPHSPTIVERNLFVTKEKYRDNKKVIDDYLKEVETHLQRFDELLKFKAYGLDQHPDFSLLVLPINHYLMLVRTKLLQLNIQVHQNKGGTAFKELQAIQDFISESMKYPDTLLGTMVNIALLKDIREFLIGAVREYPQWQSSIDLEKFRFKEDYDSIAKKTVYTESYAMHSLLNPMPKLADMLYFDDLANNSWERYCYLTANQFNELTRFFFQPNRTTNLLMSKITKEPFLFCVKNSSEKCAEAPEEKLRFTIVNPLGKKMTDIFMGSITKRYEKLYDNIEYLKTPVLF